uniref:Ankyrin repeat-containing protein n=1 Tax=Tanacetum cinerariifolium TaxID=118510 RepID=A0A699IDX0_TANCI|nr:ankyrin repeat-containing protein [Tanacetum cinerariifolium]
MRIEQYFLMTDYSLWEVILNGDSLALIRVVEGVLQPVAPTTAEQKLARKNELKARGVTIVGFELGFVELYFGGTVAVEVKKFIEPKQLTDLNINNETPEMVFTREQANSVKER